MGTTQMMRTFALTLLVCEFYQIQLMSGAYFGISMLGYDLKNDFTEESEEACLALKEIAAEVGYV